MTDFKPTRPEGADFHKCEACDGFGYFDLDLPTERECEDCSGTGEWFE